jgi:hypothetical protein
MLTVVYFNAIFNTEGKNMKEPKKAINVYVKVKNIRRLAAAHEKTQIPKSAIVEQGMEKRLDEIERVK